MPPIPSGGMREGEDINAEAAALDSGGRRLSGVGRQCGGASQDFGVAVCRESTEDGRHEQVARNFAYISMGVLHRSHLGKDASDAFRHEIDFATAFGDGAKAVLLHVLHVENGLVLMREHGSQFIGLAQKHLMRKSSE